MTTKLTVASPASFVTTAVLNEFPAIPNLGWASFIGDGSLSALDNTNLAGTGALTNIGAGPVLSPNYGRFTIATNALQTPTPDAASFTILNVSRFFQSFAIIAGAGVVGGTQLTMSYSASGLYVQNQNGAYIAAAMPGGTFAGQWICSALTKGPNGALGTIYNLSAGTTVPSATVSTGQTAAANWQIGGAQGTPSGYINPVDVAFSLGVPAKLTAAQLGQIYTALKGTLAGRGIALL